MLNWSVPNSLLAFTSRAKAIPWCPHYLLDDHGTVTCPQNPNPPMFGWCVHCLSDDHGAVTCPHNPIPPMLVWNQLPKQLPPLLRYSPHPSHSSVDRGVPRQEICRKYNENRCRFARCRFRHICQECSGLHPLVSWLLWNTPPGKGPSG